MKESICFVVAMSAPMVCISKGYVMFNSVKVYCEVYACINTTRFMCRVYTPNGYIFNRGDIDAEAGMLSEKFWYFFCPANERVKQTLEAVSNRVHVYKINTRAGLKQLLFRYFDDCEVNMAVSRKISVIEYSKFYKKWH